MFRSEFDSRQEHKLFPSSFRSEGPASNKYEKVCSTAHKFPNYFFVISEYLIGLDTGLL
jgi:hypothetical protein